MSKDWFEKSLRENYPLEVHDFDADAAWAALEARRRKKRRRPFVFWWTSALGMLLLGAVGLTLSQLRKDEIPVPTPGLKQPAAQWTQKPPIAALKKVSNHSGAAMPNVQQTEHEPSVGTLPAASRLKYGTGSLPKGRGGVGRSQSVHFSFVGTDLLSRLPSPSEESLSRTLVGRPGEELPSSELQHPILALPSLLRDIQPLKTLASVTPEKPAFFPGELKKHPRPKKMRWWIGASAHYGLSAVSRSGTEDYVKKRDSEETALDMLQVGLDVRRYLNPHFFLQSGVYFTQWTDVRERMLKETFTVADSNYLIARLIKADGTMQDVYGVADIVHTRTVTEETYNRYSLVELPLLAGISWPVGEHWRLDGALGPVFGLLSSRSGIISGDQNGTNLPLENAPYRNSATFSGMLRLEWLYAGRDWSAGVGIMARMALNDWAETNPLFSEKRHAIGAGLVFRRAIR